MCYQCCQYLHLLSVLFTVLCYDGSCCSSFGLHVSLATHQVSDVITFCSTFNSVRYGPILYLTIFLNSTIEVLLNHIASIQIFWILLFSDVGTLTLSRHILLDPIMMFFIMMSTYSQLKFLSYCDRSALSYHLCQSCIQYRYSIIAHIIYMYV